MTLEIENAAEAARSEGLGELLERVLDKGVVIAGDISIAVVGLELLTLKIRLLVASVDRAEAMGIDWWRHDPYLSSEARRQGRTAPKLEALEETLERGLAQELEERDDVEVTKDTE